MLSLVEMWIAGSVFALVAITLRYFGKHKLPQFFFYWLWNITIVVFIWPVKIPSQISVYNLIPAKAEIGKIMADRLGDSVSALADGSASLAARSGSANPDFLFAIWVVGMVALAVYFAALEIYWMTRAHKSASNRMELFIDDKRLSISLMKDIESPCVIGVFSTTIAFPVDWDFTDEQGTQLALKHELLHISHLDNIRKLIMRLLLCWQWFNPIVWLVYFLANKDMELYCDSCIVSSGCDDLRKNYAALLLHHRQAKPMATPLGLFVNQKTILRERIQLIMTKKASNTTLTVICVLCLVVLFSAFTTAPLSRQRAQDVGSMELLAPGEISRSNPSPQDKKVVYMGLKTDLGNGDTLIIESIEPSLTLSLAPVEGYDKGQISEYGYVTENSFIPLGEAKLLNGTTLNFEETPENAESLYIKNYCIDTIHILSL